MASLLTPQAPSSATIDSRPPPPPSLLLSSLLRRSGGFGRVVQLRACACARSQRREFRRRTGRSERPQCRGRQKKSGGSAQGTGTGRLGWRVRPQMYWYAIQTWPHTDEYTWYSPHTQRSVMASSCRCSQAWASCQPSRGVAMIEISMVGFWEKLSLFELLRTGRGGRRWRRNIYFSFTRLPPSSVTANPRPVFCPPQRHNASAEMETQRVLQLRPSSVPALCPAAQLATNKSIGMASSTRCSLFAAKLMNLPQTPELHLLFFRPSPCQQVQTSTIQFSTSLAHRPDGQWHRPSGCCLFTHDGGSRRWLWLGIDGVDDATYQSWSSRNYLLAARPRCVGRSSRQWEGFGVGHDSRPVVDWE